MVLLSLLIVTPLGFLCKFYRGPGQAWFNDYGAAVWYEIFWCLSIYAIFPSRKAVTGVPLGVFLATCFLEILQLWQPPILQAIRSYAVGRFLIGTTFAWWDFPHYALGSLIGWFWLRQIHGFRIQND
jgi:hypothetical protein